MSAPVSATMTWAVVAEIPGMEVSKATWGSKGTSRAQISSLERGDGAVQEVEVVDDLTAQDGVMRTEVTFECLSRAGRSSCASVPWPDRPAPPSPRSPAIMASIIARDDLDHTVDATEVSFTPASWRLFSSRWISWPRASTWVLRTWSTRAALGYRAGARRRAAPSRAPPHRPATRHRRDPFLRPGTFFTWAALQSHSSSKRPSRA